MATLFINFCHKIDFTFLFMIVIVLFLKNLSIFIALRALTFDPPALDDSWHRIFLQKCLIIAATNRLLTKISLFERTCCTNEMLTVGVDVVNALISGTKLAGDHFEYDFENIRNEWNSNKKITLFRETNLFAT